MTLPIFGALPGETRGYVATRHGQIHYRKHGEGTPVLLIHQAPWSSIQYRHALPLLAAAGYCAIAPDLPSHGMSDPTEAPSIELYADAMAAFLDGLGIGQAAVVGHHGGALVAGRLAARHGGKVRGIVLDNAPLYTAEQRAERLKRFSDPQILERDGHHFTDRWALVRRIGDPQWSDETVHLSLVAYFANGPWKEQSHWAAANYDFAPDVAKIACPALVIASRTDPVYPSGVALLALQPAWSYAELPGGAGMVFDRVGEWCVPVLEFLASLPGKG
ncbi:MAG: alpha/beta hydrolase [Rhizomicrobium sp.]